MLSCTNEATMQLALLRNYITPETFKTWQENYFNNVGHLPPLKTFTPEEIWQAINVEDPNCLSYVKVFTSDNKPTNNNDDIELEVIINVGQTVRYYEISLFYAFYFILDKCMPIESFGFTKANPDPRSAPMPADCQDIIFQITHADDTVTHWDLSGSIPPIK